MEGDYPSKPQTMARLEALHIIRRACCALLPSGGEFQQEANHNGVAIWSRVSRLLYRDKSFGPSSERRVLIQSNGLVSNLDRYRLGFS